MECDTNGRRCDTKPAMIPHDPKSQWCRTKNVWLLIPKQAIVCATSRTDTDILVQNTVGGVRVFIYYTAVTLLVVQGIYTQRQISRSSGPQSLVGLGMLGARLARLRLPNSNFTVGFVSHWQLSEFPMVTGRVNCPIAWRIGIVEVSKRYLQMNNIFSS